MLLPCLLILPALALVRLTDHVDWRLAAGYLAVVSIVTYALYAADKRQAQAGKWRTPEASLHLMELAGGWPAAFVAQRTFRHKISKPAYQITFWLILIAHQYAAGDFLLRWKMAKAVFQWMQ